MTQRKKYDFMTYENIVDHVIWCWGRGVRGALRHVCEDFIRLKKKKKINFKKKKKELKNRSFSTNARVNVII